MTLHPPSRRALRMGSGLVLFAYITVHLSSHALGLVSVAVAERALGLAVAVWHSLPGTVLLYGAAALHVALAFLAIYERRTLRMPPAQALRIVLGLGMPMLVIGHVVATRIAAELHTLAPTYARIVWTLWMADAEGRQLALLAPGWVHGCMGLQFAFGRRRAWQRWRLPLFGAALLVPVLAGLGFLAMGRELAWRAAGDPAGVPAVEVLDAARQLVLVQLRDTLVTAYLALVAAVFVARELRGRVERHRRALVRITYPQCQVEVPRGWTVLEASRGFGIAHLSLCGGQARCSTCRVRVIAGAEHCAPPGRLEQGTLARIGAGPGVRLACQLRPETDVSVVPLLEAGPAGIAAPDRPVVEHDAAVLVLRWRETGAARRSSHDGLYALNRVLAAVAQAVRAAGGQLVGIDAEGATASFEAGTDLAGASRAALHAAAAIERDLAALGTLLRTEFGTEAVFALGVDAGAVVIARLGPDRARAAFGDAVRGARALADDAARRGERCAASAAVRALAGDVQPG